MIDPTHTLGWHNAPVGETVIKHLRLVLRDPDFTPGGVENGNVLAASGARELAILLANNDDGMRSVESIYLPPQLKEGTKGAFLREICEERGNAVVFEEVWYAAGIPGISEHF